MASNQLTSAAPHWFVVVNADPVAQRVVLTAVFTSNLDRLRRMYAADTLVEIGPEDFPSLSVPTSVDCNKPYLLSLDSLAGRVRDKDVTFCARLSPERMVQIRAAILASDQVELSKKALVPLVF